MRSPIALINHSDDLQENLQADMSGMSSVSNLCCTVVLLTALTEWLGLEVVFCLFVVGFCLLAFLNASRICLYFLRV